MSSSSPADGPSRVAIIGNAGSGKSTLARRLAGRGGAALLDLDTVAWQPGALAVPRPAAAAAAEVAAFCAAHPAWVVEGCYANLIAVTLHHQPLLLFLDPGVEQCLANCRARPWEPAKYASPAEQAAHLEALLAWVRDYYARDGELSLAGHAALFDAYPGPKRRLTAPPGPDVAPPPAVRVVPLADHPEVLPVLQAWFEAEWPDWYGPGGRGDAAADLRAYAGRGLPFGLLALDGEQPCGVVALKAESLASHRHLTPWVAAGLVAPRRRRQGLGARLLAAAEAQAAARGYQRVYCATAGAARLLERAGWQKLEDAIADGQPVIVYVKRLS